ncbi:MAG TPA: AAA family ATPase [Candidatus Saccharimonadales bacterium]|nr:AAA family ATPase [Candidatus Saccharimonadales bacterium]
MKNLIVGLVGPIGVGKTRVSQHLEELGYKKLKFSDPLRVELAEKGIKVTRIALQDLGDSWRAKHSNDFLAKLLLKQIQEKPKDAFVVEGFRNPGEVKAFQKLPNFILIGLTADPKVRFERLKARSQSEDPQTWVEFEKQETRDQGIAQPENGQQVLKSLELADFLIDTDRVESEVNRSVEKAIMEFQKDVKRKNSRGPQECSFC